MKFIVFFPRGYISKARYNSHGTIGAPSATNLESSLDGWSVKTSGFIQDGKTVKNISRIWPLQQNYNVPSVQLTDSYSYMLYPVDIRDTGLSGDVITNEKKVELVSSFLFLRMLIADDKKR